MLGEVIHGYRIDRALAADKGGFGDVFFATHVDSGAEAVVKVLKAEMSAHRDIVTRFFNEARAAASIHHPGIVQIHNVGYHRDRAYLLMERLRGDDLETRVQAGPLPVERALVFMRQAAGAIGAAHDRGIVHRDLKPANLFVVADPDVLGGERVKVLDFGIAKLTVDAGAGKTQGVFGTPSYMSPEQCASTGAVDARADLYSLGCIFYELVCGRPPFGHGGLELIAAHLRDTPQPPRALAPWLPAPIEHVILQLLEKRPEQRPPSCAALIAALDHAAVAAGISGASSPHLSAATAPTIAPHVLRGTMSPSTTLGASAGAAASLPARSRGFAGWLAGGVAIAGAAVAIVVLATRGDAPGRSSLPLQGGGVAIGHVIDATVEAAPLVDAPVVAVLPEDAAVNTTDAVTSGREPASIPSRESTSIPDAKRRSRARTSDDRQPASEKTVGQAELAERLNEEGKQAAFRGDWDHATKKFQEAVARSPEAKYFINLCSARLSTGHFGAALAACRAIDSGNSTAEQRAKAAKLMAKIRDEAKAQNLKLR
jgi:serine/threonine-protein kinase